MAQIGSTRDLQRQYWSRPIGALRELRKKRGLGCGILSPTTRLLKLSAVLRANLGAVALSPRCARATSSAACRSPKVFDVRTGRTTGFLRFEGLVQEIFDIQLIPGLRYPEIAEPDSDV